MDSDNAGGVPGWARLRRCSSPDMGII